VLIRSSRNFDRERGFTILELIVSMALGLMMGAIILSSSLSGKNVLNYDVIRTRVDQSLRAGMDVLSSNIRVGGENLSSVFPAFEIIDGAAGAPDELIIRRNLLDEVLNLCTALSAGSGTSQVFFAVAAPPSAACTYSNNNFNYTQWRAYRNGNGGNVKAFIYNVSTQQGEFFDYNNETDGATSYSITRAGGTWQNSYSVGSSSVYLLEEWRFRIQDGRLQLIQNDDTANPRNVVAGMTDFQIAALLSNGTTQQAWGRTDRWNALSALDVNLSGAESFSGRLVTRSLSSRYFPRNILSQ
jgi:Tfp pilus assembly protein PilW